MLASKLLSAAGGTETLWVDDCFAVTTYTGNDSTQTINNGIDLAGKGGLFIQKLRNTYAADWLWTDTERGRTNILSSNTTAAQDTGGGSAHIQSFNSNGVTLGSGYKAYENWSGGNLVSYTFRRAPKFFDVVTYTGNNTSLTVNHSLGTTPGMIIFKAYDATGAGCNWRVWHRSLPSNQLANLNLTSTPSSWAVNVVSANSTSFTVLGNDSNGDGQINSSGMAVVAYLFAHDTSAEGIIQCGSFVGNTTVNLGWEPQFVVVKRSDNIGNWFMQDTMRGIATGVIDATLFANLSDAENTSSDRIDVTATGFDTKYGAGTYIYLAIRRPNKPPTSGTQVYNAIARTGTGAAATVTGVGFAPDLVMPRGRLSGYASQFCDRMRGSTANLTSSSTAAESTRADSVTALTMDGMTLGADSYGDFNQNTINYINHFFRRAPGVFDSVCTPVAVSNSNSSDAHSLGAVPEMIVTKERTSAGTNWFVYHKNLSIGSDSRRQVLQLNSTSAAIDQSAASPINPFVSEPTALTFIHRLNSGSAQVAYLFASSPGISKVGSYTGNGSSQTIDCGFSAGARFVLIKRTDSTGDWYVWDSVRGIVAANDPHLSLNSTAAEVTTNDSIDPANAGFIVNQVAATNINVNGGTYVFLSFS